jgi:hypothetical protein
MHGKNGHSVCKLVLFQETAFADMRQWLWRSLMLHRCSHQSCSGQYVGVKRTRVCRLERNLTYYRLPEIDVTAMCRHRMKKFRYFPLPAFYACSHLSLALAPVVLVLILVVTFATTPSDQTVLLDRAQNKSHPTSLWRLSQHGLDSSRTVRTKSFEKRMAIQVARRHCLKRV